MVIKSDVNIMSGIQYCFTADKEVWVTNIPIVKEPTAMNGKD